MRIKNFDILFYALPILIIFTIVLLAYWPGILVSDSMVQWHQTQITSFNNWHPAYNTIYIFLLTKICNNPGFVLFIQCLILSLCVAFTMTRLRKYYNVNKTYLFIMCIIFALIPLNFNFAVTLLKDTLYSAFILLFSGLILDIINDSNFFKNWKKCLLFFITILSISLFRHNGIFVVILTVIFLIFKYRKIKQIYILFFSFLIVYILLTTIGFKILKIQEGNYANKYGPISHIMARLLNKGNNYFSNEDIEILSKYVDIKNLKETYNPYNMDYSINSQNIDNIKESRNNYLKFGMKKFIEYPGEVIKYYIHLTSFLYSPIPFNGSYTVGMFTETDLWEYTNEYSYLNENSKIPSLLNILKKIETKYQTGILGILTMRPALYMYSSMIFIYILYYIKKIKNLFLILLPFLFNTLSLAPALPVAMTRYIYSTMLVFYLILTWFLYEIYKIIKDKINARKNI